MLCDTDVTRLAPMTSKTITVTLGEECQTLLAGAANHQVAAQFTTRPRSGQAGVIKNITLVLQKSKNQEVKKSKTSARTGASAIRRGSRA